MSSKMPNQQWFELQRSSMAVLASTISAILATGTMKEVHAQEQPDEITVTGSRIVRRDLTASSPIMTVESVQLEQSSTLSLESVLNRMPQFQPAATQFDSSTGTSSLSTPGLATANLRGLGSNRSLVLVDGRRAQPANANLVADINAIPSAAIARVETITGGASAVYGADALAGVVNFILRDNFEGMEYDIQTGQTEEGDGEESRLRMMLGLNTDNGRGNAILGVGWYRRDAVEQWDREFFREGFYDPNTQSGGSLAVPSFSPAGGQRPSQAAVDQVFQAAHGIPPGTVRNSETFHFNPDGTPFVRSGLGYTGPLYRRDNVGDGFVGIRKEPNGTLTQANVYGMYSSPMEQRSVYGRATYDVTDNFAAVLQGSYSNVEVKQFGGFPSALTVWQAQVPNDRQRNIPDALQTLLDSRAQPGADWFLFRQLDFLGQQETRNRNDVYQISAAFEGSLAERDLSYDASITMGRTDILSLGEHFASLDRFEFVARLPGWGQVDELEVGRRFFVRCPTGLPIFGGPPPDPSCLESIEWQPKFLTVLDQNIAEVNFEGKVADMPAGEMRFAAGIHWRENTFQHEPPEILDDRSVVEQPISAFATNDAYGEIRAAEVYGELLVPATERLDFELGYRFSDFDTVEDIVGTWKALANWRPTEAVSLRGGFQLATRAPNTTELFTPSTTTNVSFAPGDPCQYTTTAPWGNVPSNPDRDQVQQLCSTLNNEADDDPTNDNMSVFHLNPDFFERPGGIIFSETTQRFGNPNLDVEDANTFTLGLVLTGPGELDNFVASIDYYQIKVDNAIAPIDPVFVYAQCFNADGASNPTYTIDDPGRFCRMITRDPVDGERQLVDAPYSNTGVLETEGVDVGVNWAVDFGPGRFNVNAVATILSTFKTQENPQAPIRDHAGTLSEGGQFDYRLFTRFNYTFGGGGTVGLTWQHFPSIDAEESVLDPNTTVRGVGSHNIFDLFGRYPMTDRLELRGGIDNVVDEDPKIVGAFPGNAALGSTNPEYYDVLGRRFYIALKWTL